MDHVLLKRGIQKSHIHSWLSAICGGKATTHSTTVSYWVGMELQQWQGLWTERVKPHYLATMCATATLQTISNVTLEGTCITFDKTV